MEDAEARGAGRLSLAVGVVTGGSAVCLATYFLVGGPFGTINDVGNATTALLSAVLASRLRSLVSGRAGEVAVGAAVVGAAIANAGGALGVSGTTGFLLAGLVSSVGFAGIGARLLALNRGERVMAWPRALRRLGIAAGALMALGIVAAPGIILQLDDMETAPSCVWLGELGWLGIYAIYLAWALWLGFTGIRPAPAAAVAVRRGGLGT